MRRSSAPAIRFAAAMLSAPRRRYDQLILDLDGCVWVGHEPMPGAVDAIAALRDAGKRVAFATNDPRHAVEDYVAQALGHRRAGVAGATW